MAWLEQQLSHQEVQATLNLLEQQDFHEYLDLLVV
jgi:hypothetical protein